MRSLLGPEWQFERRARPAPDAINALLSFGYTLLYQAIAGLIQARGLNPHLGFFHTGSAKHLALASDLMEEFRAICIDALILNLCLNGSLTPDCGTQRDGVFMLNQSSIRTLIRAFEERMSACPIESFASA